MSTRMLAGQPRLSQQLRLFDLTSSKPYTCPYGFHIGEVDGYILSMHGVGTLDKL